MTICDACNKSVKRTTSHREVMLCETCIRRECVQDHPAVYQRPWHMLDGMPLAPISFGNDFAA
jgi:hypothetical protein